MIIRYFVFVLVVFTSCKKEETTLNKFVIYNLSGTTVKVLPTASMSDTLILKDKEFRSYDFSVERGKDSGDNYAFFADGNPVTVVFNLKDTIVHYRDNLVHSGNYYSESNNRNFYNVDSYQKEIIDNSKYQRTVTLKYIFTPKDYLDACK